tara:strand:+ start:40 stop:645 length:606 start_codon:yes stop_codon:yes gene_type:complete
MNEKNSIHEILSKNINIDLEYFNNDKYFGILLNKKTNLIPLLKLLKEKNELLFSQLVDITAIDYPSREHRFDLVYILLSLKLNKRILIKISLNENQSIESATQIYKSADWYERECYDLFGIKFVNHPDLRRIMTDYNFEGHPLRKDFPLTGHNEVRYDELEKKVIYEEVNLPQEYRNFDYLSPWEGIDNELIGDKKSDDKG